MAADPPYKEATTIYLWDANLRRNNIGHRNGIWLVFSKWDSETRRQRNKPVRPFRQKSSRKSTRPSSVTDTGDVWEEFNLGEPDINDEGVWVRIGQLEQDEEYRRRTGRATGFLRAESEIVALEALLGESRRAVIPRAPFLGITRLAPYLEGLGTVYVWNSTYPTTLLGGMWLVDWSWKEDAGVLSGGVETIYRVLPHRNRAPGQDPFETYPPNEHRGIRINTGGEWARIGHLPNMTDADPRWAQWTQLMTNITELDLDSPRYLWELTEASIAIGFIKSSRKEERVCEDLVTSTPTVDTTGSYL
ncbi:hypothetical protein FB446DRAFT_788105 [Lentinula raphanica]|nr:hypothetical protein FB446DRAFT_788105 [Lentinula raphanica]